MAGHFEVFVDDHFQFRFRLLTPGGDTLVESGPYKDKHAIAAAIFDVRECAGTGLVEDHSTSPQHPGPQTATQNAHGTSHDTGTVPTINRPSITTVPDTGTNTPLRDPDTQEEDIKAILTRVVIEARHRLRPTRATVDYGLTIHGPTREATSVSIGNLARTFAELQARFPPGPRTSAVATHRPALAPDLARDRRWPRLARAALAHGIRSALVIPLAVGDQYSAVLNVCADHPDALSAEDIDSLEQFARTIAPALKPVARIAVLDQTIQDLHAAAAHQRTINLALGIIMAQNRCTGPAAFDILRRASTTRNIKLRDIASDIVTAVSNQTPPATHHTSRAQTAVKDHVDKIRRLQMATRHHDLSDPE